MRLLTTATIFASLALPVVARAEPPSLTPPLAPRTEPAGEPTAEAEPSYRAYTMTADALSIAAMAGSFAAEGPNGRDSNASAGLLVVGMLGGAYASPIIHGVHGHGSRAIASWLIRQGAMGVGMIVGVETASCGSDAFLCGLDRLGPGALGGLVVASVIDAAILHDRGDDHPARATGTAWAPVVAPRSGGATVGFAAAF
jgi:hypothetical protein